VIETKQLSKRYGDSLVLDHVDLRIPEGGVTSIIGANGAGKSTLLTAIARLIDADGGTAEVAGMDVYATDTRELAKILAVLRQENHTLSRIRVRELVAFGRFPHSRGRLTAECEAAVDAAIETMELGEIADKFIDELSGGQRQRAFVAMVLAQDTEYILLDEPLNNLDMKHSVSMMRTIKAAAHEQGRTVVIVIHDINMAAAFSDRLVAMKNGKVHTTGAPEEVMTEETLSSLYDFPVQVERIHGRPTAIYY